jgi:hypothetical protein
VVPTYLACETPFGTRWKFQDVHDRSAAAIAGVESGDILLTVDGQDVIPPTPPVFLMGNAPEIEIASKDDLRRDVTVDVAAPKEKKLHFIEPTRGQTQHLGDGIGDLKIAMFSSMVGVEIANEISRKVEELGEIDSLIADLRGNIGGRISSRCVVEERHLLAEMIVLDTNILIRAVLGMRVWRLVETYAKHGIRFYAPQVMGRNRQEWLGSDRRSDRLLRE